MLPLSLIQQCLTNTSQISHSTEAALSNAPAEAKCHFLSDLSFAEKAVQEVVSSGRAQATKTAWAQWEKFCVELALNPLLQTVQNKVPIIQVFRQHL